MAVGGDLDKARRHSAVLKPPESPKKLTVPPSMSLKTLSVRPALRAGSLVIAREKMKWKKGGLPMPVEKTGSAFKVLPGAMGVITGTNPLRVNWGEGRIGAVRGDQIRWVGNEDGASTKLQSNSTGGLGGLASASASTGSFFSLLGRAQSWTTSASGTVSCDQSTATGDSGSRAGDDISVTTSSSKQSVAISVPTMAIRRVAAKDQYWDRQVAGKSVPVLCTGGLRLLLRKLLKLKR